MWDTISDCLEEKGPMHALSVSEVTCFSEDDDKLCATLQRWAYGTPTGYTAKCEAEEFCW